MDNPTDAELVRVALDNWPRTPEDLLSLEWPDDDDGQAAVIRHLAVMANNPAYGWRGRRWAYDRLVEIADDYSTNGGPATIPLDLLKTYRNPPKRERGRDTSENAVRDLKIAFIVKWLVKQQGWKRDDAIALVAETECLTEDAIVSVLRKEARLGKPGQRLTNGLSVWGEQTT